ncbi:MAG: glutamate racemase [Aquabacterium sp.]|nr:glutamate racemase [Aquabacterium sp.]
MALFQGAHTHIGVFDSGLGGLSILRALHARLPLADLTYVADSGHAPYGERDVEFIVARSQAICDFLVQRHVDAIVVACNTATAAAIHLLRHSHPGLPIIGVEPGVKPAVARSINKRIGVLATPSTLASEKYKRLIESHGHGATIVPQACPGLAKEIEAGDLSTPALQALVARFAEPLREAQVDTVVLGCTHYPFVAPLFQTALGTAVTIMDTSEAVAQHTARLCARHHAAPDKRQMDHKFAGNIHLFSSGNPQHLADVARHWLGLQGAVSPLP